MSEQKFLTEKREIVNQISSFFEQAAKVKCAVAFWGKKAPFKLGLRGLNKPIRIICNLESGATNPTVIRELLDIPQLEIRSYEFLHAKVYWTERGALVGSSNASINGLGFEGYETDGWIEANVVVTDRETLTEIENWFDELWEKSNPVDLSQISEIERLWRRRRNVRHLPGVKPGSSLLTALRQSSSRFFEGRDIYVIIYRKTASKEAKDAFQDWKQQQVFSSPTLFQCFENWSQLPRDATIIVLYYGPRGGIKYEGLFKLPESKIEVPFRYSDGVRGSITIAFQCEDINGIVVQPEDEVRLKAKVTQLYDSPKATPVGAGRIISLYDAYSILL